MPLKQCLAAIDEVNAQDPKQEMDEKGQMQAACLLYGQRMSQVLNNFQPEANEVLQIAVRAQHIQRWHIPRSDYPMDRPGYLRWRRELGAHHAELCGKIMSDFDYNDADVEKAKSILRKQKLKQDPDTQTLEDVACLVFLQYYFADFAKSHSEEKIISIVQKTWRKMSDNAQQTALGLSLGEQELGLIQKALA
ncbi:DUF4202 domain-containing protein [Pseudoteredinibacter isoporae]|uniref:DUF4202 domain-containing protein n=1 Tax=Pseudoteredinibacter isoporae TaxID=570281 RepID=A0A7X0JWB0_9GAMM|nr:DUF4202 domain-containing protein [Pseudoteredinibacter isoporae]MBB6522471.1 hypothetical protein [Pseudoteredinibacter isoporae]NHO88001.1 DUF4202 domain-containing protein [Pseudoteredinibacter isoporae]NIB23668.1 DUF4202 domain-containing protein [Pseudoteredinibacter isoporae]